MELFRIRTGLQTVRYARARVIRAAEYNDAPYSITPAKPYEPGVRPVYRAGACMVGGK